MSLPLHRFLGKHNLFISMSSLSLFLVVFLTGILLVAAGLGIALLLAPHSFNLQKGEPYECGIPTHGTSWMQFKVGYYLYAILYLMFDVETIFLFPWSTIVRDLGYTGLYSILFFIVILGLGLAYAWKKGVLKWN
jgi:NADH-quinone oxidoreductase subunit A